MTNHTFGNGGAKLKPKITIVFSAKDQCNNIGFDVDLRDYHVLYVSRIGYKKNGYRKRSKGDFGDFFNTIQTYCTQKKTSILKWMSPVNDEQLVYAIRFTKIGRRQVRTYYIKKDYEEELTLKLFHEQVLG